VNRAALNARCFVAKNQLVCRYGMAEIEGLGKAALSATFRSQCMKSGVSVAPSRPSHGHGSLSVVDANFDEANISETPISSQYRFVARERLPLR